VSPSKWLLPDPGDESLDLARRLQICARPLREDTTSAMVRRNSSDTCSSGAVSRATSSRHAGPANPAAVLKKLRHCAEDREMEAQAFQSSARCFVGDTLPLVGRADEEEVQTLLGGLHRCRERVGSFKGRSLADLREARSLLRSGCGEMEVEAEALISTLEDQNAEADSLNNLFTSIEESLLDELRLSTFTPASQGDNPAVLNGAANPLVDVMDELDLCVPAEERSPGPEPAMPLSVVPGGDLLAAGGEATAEASSTTGEALAVPAGQETLPEEIAGGEEVTAGEEKAGEAFTVQAKEELLEEAVHSSEDTTKAREAFTVPTKEEALLEETAHSREAPFLEILAARGDSLPELELGLHSPCYEAVSGLELSPVSGEDAEATAEAAEPEGRACSQSPAREAAPECEPDCRADAVEEGEAEGSPAAAEEAASGPEVPSNQLSEEHPVAAVLEPAAAEAELERPQHSTPVLLHIYDVSKHPSVQWINKIFANQHSPVKFGGLFHVGVEVAGHEWAFGHCPTGSGVGASVPRTEGAHSFRETYPLPNSQLSASEIRNVITLLQAEYKGTSYNIFHRNCCHFADDLCRRLGVGPIPSWVYRLATLGGNAAQALGGLDEQVGVLKLSRSSHNGVAAALLKAARQPTSAALPSAPAAQKLALAEVSHDAATSPPAGISQPVLPGNGAGAADLRVKRNGTPL